MVKLVVFTKFRVIIKNIIEEAVKLSAINGVRKESKTCTDAKK